MTRSGKSRAAASASAMPSMIGILMSVSSRSKARVSPVKISSASAPSAAVTVSWPSMATARATSVRIDSSSSAISTRGKSGSACGDVALVEEAYVDGAPFRRRRGKPRLEPGLFAGVQHGLLQHRIPGIDLGTLRVAYAKAQPRQLDRLPRLADDDALDHQHRL